VGLHRNSIGNLLPSKILYYYNKEKKKATRKQKERRRRERLDWMKKRALLPSDSLETNNNSFSAVADDKGVGYGSIPL